MLKIENITKSYGDNLAVDKLSFQVEEGEIFGLLGSNKATEDKVKLFPRNGQPIVDKIQEELENATGKKVEVMIYGDGAFKDPVGKIWELADPVVSPAYTSGLEGQPNEVKLKYLADNDFAHLKEVLETTTLPVIAEGKVDLPEKAKRVLELGCHAVVSGGAITRPQEITAKFIAAINS